MTQSVVLWTKSTGTAKCFCAMFGFSDKKRSKTAEPRVGF